MDNIHIDNFIKEKTMEANSHMHFYTLGEYNNFQAFLLNQEDTKDCLRFFEGLISATLLSIPLWTAIVWIFLSSL